MTSTAATNGTPDEFTTRGRIDVLEAFVDAADEALFAHDVGGRIMTANHSAERISGYLEDELLGQPVTFLFPEHLRASAEAVFDIALAGADVDHVELEIDRKDGMPIPISLSLRPLVGDDGAVFGMVAIARDITEQRLAQATLAETEARMRDGEALAHVGRWLWDLGTNAVQWSDELHRIHGIDPLDFDGTLDAHLACVAPADRAAVDAVFDESVTAGRPLEIEYRITRPDGEERWLYCRAEPALGSAGAVVGLRGIEQDVTSRRPAAR